MEPELLTRKQIGNLIGKSQATMSNIVNHSKLDFPKAIKIVGSNNFWYLKSEVEEWVKKIDLKSLTFTVYQPVSQRYATDQTICAFYHGVEAATIRMENYLRIREERMRRQTNAMVQIVWDDELIITEIKEEPSNEV